MNQRKTGEFIASLRKEKGYTQKRLAEILEISEKTISKWECGNGLPEVTYMVSLCNVLGITVNELLSGEKIPFIEMIKKTEETFMFLVKQIEIEQLKNRIYKQYGLEINNVEFSKLGAGSITYIIACNNGKYVVKYPADNGMNHIDEEPAICTYLLNKGINVSEFVLNLQNKAISIDEDGRKYHIQKFIEGKTYQYHSAPKWLIVNSAAMLGKIHKAFSDYPRLNEGIGENFFQYRTIEKALISFNKSLDKAILKSDEVIVSEIKSNIKILEHFPNYSFDVNKFTNGNTHGDYMISQLICGENKINGVIDWTSSCVHPLVWEIIRSYVYLSPDCIEGEINIDEFIEYVKSYLKYNNLNSYDLINMGKMFFYFTAVCDFYSQYYESLTENREIYLKQALFSSKLLRWFNNHINELTDRISTLGKELNLE